MPDKDAIMHRWDIIRSKLQKGHSGSEPRDIFENILEDYEEELKREREAQDELLEALHSLLLEAKCRAGMSKHLMRECEEAEQLINKLKSDRSKSWLEKL